MIVLDIGARGVRAGFAGTADPIEVDLEELWPLDTRQTHIVDVLQATLHSIYTNYLLVDGKSTPVAVLEHPFMSVKIKHDIAFVLFNYFQVPSLTFVSSAACTTISTGAHSALVVDIGWHETTVTPVYELVPLKPHSTSRASKLLHDQVSSSLQAHTSVDPTADETMQFMRSLYCSTTPAPVESMIAVTLSDNTFYVPSTETRLNPVLTSFFERDLNGDDLHSFPIPDIIISSLLSLDIDVRSNLLHRITFTGKSSSIPGLKSKIINSVRSGLTEQDSKNFKYYGCAPDRVRAIKCLGPWAGASLYFMNYRLKGIDRDKFLTDTVYANEALAEY